MYDRAAGTLRLSIVIPSAGREEVLADCLRDLGLQAVSDIEYIAVLQFPSETRIRRLREAGGPRLRLFDLREPNASLARNIGLREARGEVVLFLDDDVRIPNPDFLHNHLRHYADPRVSGVYGQVLELGEAPTDRPEPGEIETDWGWMKLPANYARPCRTRNGASNNLSVRRDWALAVGGMDAWFEKGARREETEFNLRYTKRYGPLVFDPEAGLTHLSAGGGSRSWGHVRRTVPMHHIVGHWYFLLRALRDQTIGARSVLLEIRHIAVALVKNPQIGANPAVFVTNFARAGWGLAIAVTRVIRGPRRIDRLDPEDSREMLAAAETK